jgi:hypothetical protein
MAPGFNPSKGMNVGDELASVLPKDSKPWYRKAHLLKLNFTILSLVLFCKFLSRLMYAMKTLTVIQHLPMDMMGL